MLFGFRIFLLNMCGGYGKNTETNPILFGCVCAAGTFPRQSEKGKKVDRRRRIFFMLFGFQFNDGFQETDESLGLLRKWIYYSSFVWFAFFSPPSSFLFLLNRNGRKSNRFCSLWFHFFVCLCVKMQSKKNIHVMMTTMRRNVICPVVTVTTTSVNKITLSKQIGFTVNALWEIFLESLFGLIGAIYEFVYKWTNKTIRQYLIRADGHHSRKLALNPTSAWYFRLTKKECKGKRIE